MNQQKNLLEIEQALKKRTTRDPRYKSFREKTTQLPCLGTRVPVIRETLTTRSWLEEDPAQQLAICDFIWKQAKIFEVMSLALYRAQDLLAADTKNLWRVTKHWIRRIENWEHADNLSYVYSHLFERHPDLVYPTLQKWNASKNPWERRISIVSLIYYASKKRTPPPVDKILPLVQNLLADKDDYVQKGVGWTLRECGNIYPHETYSFLQRHILDLSAIAFSYSTEKLVPTKKAPLRNARKNSRKRP